MQRMIGGLVIAGVLGLSSAASAQDTTKPAPAAPADAPASKKVTLLAGADFANAYLFRGIFQEDSGLIVQPYVDVGFSLYEGEGALSAVSANVGIWNSLHSGPSGADHPDRGAWYESDFYGSVTFTFGKWKPGALYTAYTSPNDAFGTVHELAAVVTYDDSESAFPLNPKAILAFEFAGEDLGGGVTAQADGGLNKGTYLELGVRPVVTVAEHPKYPMTVAIPAKFGFSLKDYYEGAIVGSTENDAFGYFDLGAIASVPLAFMNGKSTWEVHGGVDFLFLGRNMKALNGGDRVKPIVMVGFSVTY
jgi:hypothetical protein